MGIKQGPKYYVFNNWDEARVKQKKNPVKHGHQKVDDDGENIY
jgi:hypothetical protein